MTGLEKLCVSGAVGDRALRSGDGRCWRVAWEPSESESSEAGPRKPGVCGGGELVCILYFEVVQCYTAREGTGPGMRRGRDGWLGSIRSNKGYYNVTVMASMKFVVKGIVVIDIGEAQVKLGGCAVPDDARLMIDGA